MDLTNSPFMKGVAESRGMFSAGSQPLTAKLFKVMKITMILLTAACLQVAASGDAQTVTLNLKNAPVQKVFTEVIRQTGVSIVYNEAMFHDAAPVTINVTDATVQQVLDKCLQGQPFAYRLEGGMIIIARSEPVANVIASEGKQPPIDIKGRITNEDGEPVAASVIVKGTQQGTTSNADGYFELKAVDENATLLITGISIEKLEIKINGKTNFDLTAKIKVSPLDEMQVIAYGTKSKRLQTGNVSTVKREDIEKQPVNNVLLALQGRVPGLFITQSSGLPGAGVTVRIQGQNSIRGGNDPLYVVDGIPYTSQMLITTTGGLSGMLGTSGASSYAPGGRGNPLSYINPDDIESIDVLKDADATSIYGSRAANGAILITTKKGKSGQTIVNIDLQQGWSEITKTRKMMNTSQYISMRKEALRNDNVIVSSSDGNYDINGLWDMTRYTDWVKTLVGGTAKSFNVNATISGGSANTQYLIGGSYYKENTVFPGEFNDQKGSIHFNLNSISPNNRLRLQLTGNYLGDNNQLPRLDLTNQAYTLPPNAPALYNSDGTLNWAPNLSGNSSWTNPLANLYNTYQNKTSNLTASNLLTYQIFTKLELSTRLGYNKLETNEFAANSLLSMRPERRPTSQRSARYSFSKIEGFIVEPQLVYKSVVNKGQLEILGGFTIQQTNSSGQVIDGLGHPTEESLKDMRSATSVSILNSIEAKYKYNAAFGRMNYNWQNKYLLNFNLRRDGSSHFGPENRFQNFASAAVAWIFSEEKAIKQKLSFLSFGKIKASYGTTGNDQVGDYTFMDLYDISTPTVPYQGGASLVVNRFSNPLLQWEETQKISFGIDLGFIKDKILLQTTFSNNVSSNQLLPYALPVMTGFLTVDRNFPASVRNRNWEFVLNTENIVSKNFKWKTILNMTLSQNKLLDFPNLENSSYATTLIVGQPLNIKKVYSFLGVDPATGIYQFSDANGNVTVNPNFLNDKNILVNVDPKIYGGFQNSLSYKEFQVDALFQFVKQTAFSAFEFGYSFPPGNGLNNQPIEIHDRWQKSQDNSQFQRYSSSLNLNNSFSNAVQSNAAYLDGSYIRLKNLSISYGLPNNLVKKMHLQQWSFYLQGQNLLTFTKYGGIDPENQSVGAIPPLKTLTIGTRIKL